MESAKSASGGTPAHDWLRPRLNALLAEAQKAGFERETIVATVVDLVTAPPFDQLSTPEGSVSQAGLPDESIALDAASLEFNAETEASIRDSVERDIPGGLDYSFRRG